MSLVADSWDLAFYSKEKLLGFYDGRRNQIFDS